MATQTQHSFGTATESRATDDGFFGGAIVPAGAAGTTGYQTNPLPQAATKPSGSPLPVILLVLGLVLMSGAAYEGYNLWANRSPIHMPDQMLGMNRVEDGSPLATALDSVDSQFESADLDHLQVAGYGDTTQFVVVVAGTFSGTTPEQAQFVSEFEAGQDVSNGEVSVRKVDAGPLGGTVRCGATTATQNVSFCIWVSQGNEGDERVLGFTLFGGWVASDPAQAMVTVRAAVEN